MMPFRYKKYPSKQLQYCLLVKREDNKRPVKLFPVYYEFDNLYLFMLLGEFVHAVRTITKESEIHMAESIQHSVFCANKKLI